MSQTYTGTTLAVVAGAPGTYDIAGYELLAFVSGACALWECPPMSRSWGKGKEDLVCRTTDYEYKTSALWDEMSVKFSDIPSDAAQLIYETLEADFDAEGSFELVLPGGRGTYFFTAQVSKFALFDGGTKDSLQTRSGTLLLQSEPVYKAAP